VINLRGRVVTVVDLRMLLGIPDGATKSEKIILLDQGRRDLGLLVTEVDGIELLEKISPSPGRTAPAVRGVARLRRSAVTVLDIEGINGAVAALFPKRITG
jgi:purine-binding chemotaxis protein CheW